MYGQTVSSVERFFERFPSVGSCSSNGSSMSRPSLPLGIVSEPQNGRPLVCCAQPLCCASKSELTAMKSTVTRSSQEFVTDPTTGNTSY